MTAYPVLGQARGGTSAVAGLLRIAGVHMGDRWDGGPATDNHEDIDLRNAPVDVIATIAAARHATYPRWGWKDPELIDRWRHVRPSIPDAKPIVVLRDPDDVADSIARWDGIDPAPIMPTIRRRYDALVTLADAGTFTVQFGRLRADPRTEVPRIAEHAGTHPTAAMYAFVSGRYSPIPDR